MYQKILITTDGSTVSQHTACAGVKFAQQMGAEVLALFGPLATRFELTEVHGRFGGDTTMPYPGPQWRETARTRHEAGAGHPAYTFVTLDRSPHLEEGSKP